MSYTIEVYWGNQKAERNFGIYALYVMFYPQLVAGPIERPQNILHQFYIKQQFNYDNAVLGLNLIVYGLFKKIVIADRLSEYVNHVYKDVGNANSATAWLASYFFAVQIYCDFSGYSDIARGTAKFMGFDLMVNFNRPFLSQSISEFWKRWHISLSAWFNDYLFNPLVASLRSWRRWAIVCGLLITFFLSGLWHGASWNYVIWGLLYGVALVYEFFTKDFRRRLFGKLPQWPPCFSGLPL
jgi:D-alanyl-lipoteichoic acid acyltransferase DltB (MBOAT superfamily)